jgi:hypothetical protein
MMFHCVPFHSVQIHKTKARDKSLHKFQVLPPAPLQREKNQFNTRKKQRKAVAKTKDKAHQSPGRGLYSTELVAEKMVEGM